MRSNAFAKVSLPVISLSALSILLTGCTLQNSGAPSIVNPAPARISGLVHGGQQPISGATIQLYAANSTASKGESAALISSTIMTDAGGDFSISNDYKCPTPDPLVYIVATGGNPGLDSDVYNNNIALMTLLGPCSTLTTSTFIMINELTTVAAVESLAPFMVDFAHVGSNPANTAGLSGAFAGAETLVDFSTGQVQPSGNGLTPPVALLFTLETSWLRA